MPPRQNPDAPVVNPNPTPNPNPVNPTVAPRPANATPPTGPAFNDGQAGNYTPPEPPVNPDDSPAFARIRDLLDAYGLGSLADWLRNEIIQGHSETQVIQSLREREEYKQRFRGLEVRRSAGLNPMTVDEYLAYERQAAAMMRSFGFPPGFYDQPADFADLIGKDVSINELQQRLSSYAEAVYQQPVEVRRQLRDLYGVDEPQLAAFFADPERGWQTIQKQYMASQVAGAANRQRFGALTAAEAERLAELGVTGEQAAQGFGALAQTREVTGALAGEDAQSAMTRADQIAAVGGDAEAQAEMERRRRRRQAAFSGGGSFANSAEGLSVGSNLAGS